MHVGKHRHLAQDIESGDRTNIIIWAKSKTYRMKNVKRDKDGFVGYRKKFDYYNKNDNC